MAVASSQKHIFKIKCFHNRNNHWLRGGESLNPPGMYSLHFSISLLKKTGECWGTFILCQAMWRTCHGWRDSGDQITKALALHVVLYR